NSANFSNTIFITTIDYNYFLNVLREEESMNNPEEYLKKMFQWTIKIPIVLNEKLTLILSNLFIKDFPDNKDQEIFLGLLKCLEVNRSNREYLKLDKDKGRYITIPPPPETETE